MLSRLFVRLPGVWFLGLALFPQAKEAEIAIESLEKERDFYFEKLRNIEVICQEGENEEIPGVKRILEILYATEVSFKNNKEIFIYSAIFCKGFMGAIAYSPCVRFVHRCV